MDNCKIIEYSGLWRDKLRTFLLKTFPDYSKEYVDYCLDHSSGHTPAQIIINDQDEIVGCNLCTCTSVLFDEDVKVLPWSHDTYIDDNYRSKIGLEMMIHMRSIEHFGLGLTDIKRKIEKKLGSIFFEGVYTYYLATPKVLLSFFQKLFNYSPALKLKNEITVNNNVFHLVDNAEEMAIPNEGFWFKGFRDLDFVRDSSFINDRFINNNVFSYHIYSTNVKDNPCYFVIRKTKYRGYPSLAISDFRYDPTHPEMVRIILKAVKHIAIRNNLGIILFICGDKNFDMALKHKLSVCRPIDFVTNIKKMKGSSFIITGADSDGDFLK